jgi:hypothetical protein
MPTANYRLEIVVRLFYELLPLVLITLITFAFNRFKLLKTTLKENGKYFLLFAGLGFSGTLPLTLTMVQKGFYMVPAFPYFALAFAVLLSLIIRAALKKVKVANSGFRIFTLLSLFTLITVGIKTFQKFHSIEREEMIITDVYEIGKVVPKYSVLTVHESMYDQYNFILQGYLVRYLNVSISPYDNFEYFLKEKSSTEPAPINYKKVELNLKKYELFRQIMP